METGKLVRATLVCLFVLVGNAPCVAETSSQTNSPLVISVPGADLFVGGVIPKLRIRITEEDLARLRQQSRQNVAAVVEDGDTILQRVAIHLKGSTGSFRSVDDKPALTLTFDKFVPGQRFRGLSKVYLNNSVEDPSFFNELAGSELFRAAGVPAPRVTHAIVELNGRRLGLYVLKEGFTPEFLGQHFRKPNGNLYETGTGYDVEEALEKDRGDGPDDRSDLLELAAAAREPVLAKRWESLGNVLDVERFISFMAMEAIACHRDGYCLARNNFRVYHEPEMGRMVFLPHGMDQLFGRPDATPHPAMSGLVARALLETPDGRCQYRERLLVLASNVLDVAALQRRADSFLEHVKPMIGTREFRDLKQAVEDVKERIAQRKQFLEQRLGQPEPTPPTFENGVLRLAGWRPAERSVGGTMDRSPAPDGRKSLHISASRMTSASWRMKVLLPKNQYRFEAAVFTKAIRALEFGNNKGAGLRVVAGTASPPYRLVGDHTWTKLEQHFTLEGEQEVELFCELRAAGGDAWFDLDSLRLVQTEP